MTPSGLVTSVFYFSASASSVLSSMGAELCCNTSVFPSLPPFFTVPWKVWLRVDALSVYRIITLSVWWEVRDEATCPLLLEIMGSRVEPRMPAEEPATPPVWGCTPEEWAAGGEQQEARVLVHELGPMRRRMLMVSNVYWMLTPGLAHIASPSNPTDGKVHPSPWPPYQPPNGTLTETFSDVSP
jgi:hypothetical protein